MNLARFFKTSALLGVLGGILLNAPLQAMENDGAAERDDKDVGALAGRVAAASLETSGGDEGEKQLSRSLPPKVVSDFMARFQGVRHGYPAILGNGRQIIIKFRLMLDGPQDLRDLQRVFGAGNGSQYNIIMQENVDAVLKFTDHGRAGKFKWFFYYPNEAGEFVPGGFVFVEAAEVAGFDFAGMMVGPRTPTMVVAAPKSSLYATEMDTLKPVITTFFRDAISRCGATCSEGAGAQQPWDAGQILTAFDGDSGMIRQVADRFNLNDFKDVPGRPGVTYSADLLVWQGGEETLKRPVMEFGRTLLKGMRKLSGRSEVLTAADEAQLEITYGGMLEQQALAFIEYDAFLRSSGRRPLNIDGLTWVITARDAGPYSRVGAHSQVVAIMTGQKGGGVQFKFDPEIAPTADAPLAKAIADFFTGELIQRI